ncbi:glycerol-3-phosphate dehydrogenase [Pararhizobium capsulatum DSM 1112]|uniref:Glycerol-3-phosphate dehydrogenase n=1 Tax=Pararhizobium capsulatum DSM 1112 TaxID=1121113 RepID=A0ABU0C2J7_9HYPH|nr:glycerol-3-phosphate dehydrogenase [Pararhizobium capsulatum]MDQ0324141.1 glycerol-3-phosphate dehydrogenase [Pararhizobium capsulatum DSM 1112]
MTIATYDLAIIGGGINGAGLARDAAGRGLSVFPCEKSDIGSATSSASTKLIQGGLRYLEHYQLGLVRHALREREVLWKIAQHIIWPLRFVLPHRKGMWPDWLLRFGLLIYDHLGGRKTLPGTQALNHSRDPLGVPLRDVSSIGFEYSDCWVQDNRLVVLNVRDAENRGADIRTRTRLVRANRENGFWQVSVEDTETGVFENIRSRALVNAAYIVVPRVYEHDRGYMFQNPDGRVFFAVPYGNDFTLIGTTDVDFKDQPDNIRISDDETDYFCKAASSYFKTWVKPSDVVWSYSGVRPLYNDGAAHAQKTTRDYVLEIDGAENEAPLLTIFGGMITTYRCLTEDAIETLASRFPKWSAKAACTDKHALPGGDFPADGAERRVQDLVRDYGFLDIRAARRLVRHYGSEARDILAGSRACGDLGRSFNVDLPEAEVQFPMARNCARTSEDMVFRRTKAGIRMNLHEIAELDAWMLKHRTAARMQRQEEVIAR